MSERSAAARRDDARKRDPAIPDPADEAVKSIMKRAPRLASGFTKIGGEREALSAVRSSLARFSHVYGDLQRRSESEGEKDDRIYDAGPELLEAACDLIYALTSLSFFAGTKHAELVARTKGR